MLAAEFGKKAVDHHTYVIASDGDLMEGISQEAIAMAGHWKLNKLIVLFDDNDISIDGPLSIADSVDQLKRFQAAGWRAERINGHDPEAIAAAIERAKKSSKPSLIACKTVIGYGAPKKAGTSKAHGEPLGADELKGAKEKLGIAPEPFAIAPTCSTPGARSAPGARPPARPGNRSSAPCRRRSRPSSAASHRPRAAGQARQGAGAHKKALLAPPQHIATRKSSELAIEAIVPAMPEFLAGSADLTGSNNTKAKSAVAFSAKTPRAATSTTASASTAWPRP